MKIKRKITMSMITNRRFIIRQASMVKKPIACDECGEPMLSTEQAAVIFSIRQRQIFRIIETGITHFSEIKGDAVMICLTSLAIFLENESPEKRKLRLKDSARE